MRNDTEEWWNIWRGIDLLYKNWHEEFDEVWPKYSKVPKICTLMGSFDQSITYLSSKSTEKSSFMTLKSDAKFEDKLTCGLENDFRNLANFHQSTQKYQNWDFGGILLSEVENIRA